MLYEVITLLEEGTEEMTLFLENGSRTYTGKQIIPILKQLVEFRTLLDKIVHKGVSEEVVRLMLRLGVKPGLIDLNGLLPYLQHLGKAYPGGEHSVLDDGRIILRLGNVRTALDAHIHAALASYEYGLLHESHRKVRELFGSGRGIVSTEGKELFATTRITSYNVCYTKLLRDNSCPGVFPYRVVLMSKLWQDTLTQLEANLNPQHFTTWIKPLHLVKIERDLVILEVPNRFVLDWVRDNYAKLIQQVLADLSAVSYRRITSYNVCYTKLLRFRLEKDLMLLLLWEAHHLVLDRRAVTWPDPLDYSRVER